MTTLKTTFGHANYSDQALNESLDHLLRENSLGAMASVRGTEAYVNTAYFVYTDELALYFLSQPTDTHSGNIVENHSVAVAIWGTPEHWGENLHGVQFFGTCEQLGFGTELVTAMRLFLQRFPAFKAVMKQPGEFADGVASRMYAVRVSSLKLLDEPRFGRRKYIEIKPLS